MHGAMARGDLRFNFMQLKEIPLQMFIRSPKQDVDEQAKHMTHVLDMENVNTQSVINTMRLMCYTIGGLYLLTSFEILFMWPIHSNEWSMVCWKKVHVKEKLL